MSRLTFSHSALQTETRFSACLGDGYQYRGNYGSNSPSVNRSTKLTPEPPTATVNNPSSPQVNRRASPSPQAMATNPFQAQQAEVSAPAVGTLLDITGDDATPFAPAAPVLTNTQNDLFDLNMDVPTTFSAPVQPSKPNDLLGVDFNSMSLDKPILHRNASETVLPPPIQATNVSKTETKSTSSQNINRLDPFKDLFASSSSTAPKTSSNESLAAKQAAGMHNTCAMFFSLTRQMSRATDTASIRSPFSFPSSQFNI